MPENAPGEYAWMEFHARRNGAGAIRFGRQVIDIFNFQCIAWGNSQDWCDVVAFVGERVATIRVSDGVEREGKLMIARTEFRRFRKWRSLVSSR
jgi:hypothetical protein